MFDYDDAYRSTSSYFGEAPDPLLDRFLGLVEAGAHVLDVGCGQGRNTLFLARRGRRVTAIDPSAVAIEQVTRHAAAEGVEINPVVGGFGNVDLEPQVFGAVMVFGLIPDLPGDRVKPLIGWARSKVANGGSLWLTGFTTEDPAFERHRNQWRSIDVNSFVSPDGMVRTYLAPGEILGSVSDAEVLHHWEGLGPEHRHGDGPVERHGRFEAIFRLR